MQDEVRAGCRVEQGEETEGGARPGDHSGEAGALVEAGGDGDEQENKPERAVRPAGRVDQPGGQQSGVEEHHREEIAAIAPPGQECDPQPGYYAKDDHPEGEIPTAIDVVRCQKGDQQVNDRATEKSQDDREPHPAVEFIEGNVWPRRR